MRWVLPISLTMLVLATFPLITFVYAQGNAAASSLVGQQVDRVEAQQASRSAKLDELRTSREARRAKRKTEVEAKRAEMKTKRDAIIASFQARLVEIKDQRKARILENLNNRYSNINERWTTRFNNILDRLEEILAKIGTHGVDITAPQSAIDSARAVVDNQAAQVYVINITNETSLRSDAKAVHERLRKDLGTARTAVKTAREAVKAAAQQIARSQSEEPAFDKPAAANDIIQ